MSCYYPVKAYRCADGGVVFDEKARHDIVASLELSCGRCIGCRIRRAQEWAVRCTHEAQCWEVNSFITLTYSDAKLPVDGGLDHRHFELFMKRTRERLTQPVRYFMCGEYGEETWRPHYHAIMFNVEFRPWKLQGKSSSGNLFYSNSLLTELWGLGHCTVQPVTAQTVGYCTRYVVDKLSGEIGAAVYGERKPPYCAASSKPGIGKLWYDCFGRDKAKQDFIVFDGREVRMPRYYDKLAERAKFEFLDEIAWERELRAKAVSADNTDERLRAREVVQRARQTTKRRNSV